MLELGAIIPSEEPSGTVHYIVVETGERVVFEKVEDFIIRNRVITTGDVYRTLRDIIEDEKRRIIKKGVIDVQSY